MVSFSLVGFLSLTSEDIPSKSLDISPTSNEVEYFYRNLFKK